MWPFASLQKESHRNFLSNATNRFRDIRAIESCVAEVQSSLQSVLAVPCSLSKIISFQDLNSGTFAMLAIEPTTAAILWIDYKLAGAVVENINRIPQPSAPAQCAPQHTSR